MKRAEKTTQTSALVDDDPRFVAVINAFAADPTFAAVSDEYKARQKAGRDRKFGSNGLKVNGKLFAMLTRGKLVVKLPKERVNALVVSREGEYFDPGHGRLMKQWAAIVSTTISWVDLSKEAYHFVKGEP